MGRLSSSGGVRTIPRNYRSLTGKVSFSGGSEAQPFESSLERDFYQILDFDHQATSATAQPFKIPYEIDGELRHYFPDVLVRYTDHISVVYEIKYRCDLATQWADSVVKFKAAVKFCKANGMVFRILTDKEIRAGSIMANIQFLRGFREIPIEYGVKKRLIDGVRVLGPALTPKILLEATYDSEDWKLRAMPVLWFLIANRMIEINFFERLTMNSHIWLSERTLCQMPLSLSLRKAR